MSFGVGLVLGLSAAGVSAKAGAPRASVTQVDDVAPRWAPNGKAQAKMLARGQNAYLGTLTMDAGAKVPEHRDSAEEFVYIVEGQGVITIDGKAHKVKAGSAIYMPAKAKVRFKNGTSTLRALQIFAGPEPADKYARWKATTPAR